MGAYSLSRDLGIEPAEAQRFIDAYSGKFLPHAKLESGIDRLDLSVEQAMVDALAGSFGREIKVLPTPELVGALGADVVAQAEVDLVAGAPKREHHVGHAR